MKTTRKYDVKAILADPVRRRALLARCVRSMQAQEGRDITWERAYEVVDQVAREKRCSKTAGQYDDGYPPS